ncbi:MAG TPA: hypothetical protein VH437_11790 [Terriglobales bacterium]|jgi:hypothetical protein
MSVLEALGDLAFREPIVITKDRVVIDGYARWQLARQQGRTTIVCIEYDLTEEESIQWLVQSRRPNKGQNAYTRIILALDSEPYLQERARQNLRTGTSRKGSSNLTKIQRIDVRSEVAAIAGVADGSVTKVKQLRKTAVPAVEQAVRDGEISIHRAWLWSYEVPERQLEYLRLHRLESEIKKKAKILVTQHQTKLDKSSLDPRFFTMPELVEFVDSFSESFAKNSSAFGAPLIATLNIDGQGIFITRDLVEPKGKEWLGEV